MAQCVARSQRTGERCKRRASAGASTCYYHGSTAGQIERASARRGADAKSQAAAAAERILTTRELSKRTWPDYVRFFSQGHGWDHCGCTAYQGFCPPLEVRAWSDKRDWNLDVKCKLVENHRAHGVLVYDGTDPVGWCQFGPESELPIRDGGVRRRRLFGDDEEKKWRITCFCQDPDYAGSGVAGVALRASLEAIARRDGGLVEAWPVAHVNLDKAAEQDRRRLNRWYNKFARLRRAQPVDEEVLERHVADAPPGVVVAATDGTYELRGVTLLELRGGRQLHVDGVGKVRATGFGRFHGGTVAMFLREGFAAVSVLPTSARVRDPDAQPSRVVMQRVVQSSTR